MNNIKVSVITTVYNVEEWLNRNIQSFLKQTLLDSELVLINDCSPDDSYKILDKYKNNRIKIINNNTNLGPGISRLIGLDNSSGDYTIFVDGDDWLEVDCLEKMYEAAIRENADIVSCKTILHNDYGLLKDKEIGYIYQKEDFYSFINNKLIKREIWNETNYSPLVFREDINTLFRCLEISNKTIKIDYAGYHYNLRPNSLTSTKNIMGKSYLYNALAIIENIEFSKNRKVSLVFLVWYNIPKLKIAYIMAKYILGSRIDEYKKECKIIDDYLNKYRNEKENRKYRWLTCDNRRN